MSSNRRESSALKSILDGPLVEDFLSDIWQKACVIFSDHHVHPDKAEQPFDREQVVASPYSELIRCGWSSLTNLLEQSRLRYNGTAVSADSIPLLFQSQESVDPQKYNGSLYHAYLDGCSVVINHADETCPYIAALCQNFQDTFPHAYANTYLTPPHSQAVPPHADDRDVLVIQVYGQKQWKVYEKIPVPFPYSHEQVGKEGMEIPPEVLEGPLLIDRILKPGDVLYMPRGYVHEASSPLDQPSYHVTVALATHDWTLSGMFSNATQHTLSRIIDYRMALPVNLGRETCTEEQKMQLQEQIDHCFGVLREQITANAVINNMGYKYQRHNQRVLPIRQICINQASRGAPETTDLVGRSAAIGLRLSNIVRASTPEEKASIDLPPENRGLHTREAIADSIMSCLHQLKTAPDKTCRVSELRSLMDGANPLVCDLTLLSFAKCCVEMGALAVVR